MTAVVLAGPSHAQATPEEQCAGLKSNTAAYEKCVETVRQSQSRVATAQPSPNTTTDPGTSGNPAVEESRNAQRRQTTIAVIAGITVAVLLVGFSILRTVRRTRSYPVDEVTQLIQSMIPDEVRERDPSTRAVPIPAGGGRTTGRLMALSVVVAVVAIAGGLAIALTGNSDKIWIVPIVLLPFGALYAWWVVRVGTKSSDDWLAPLGLRVTKTPGAVIGPNPTGFVGGNLMRPYVVGPTVIEGTRFGRDVSITQESAGVGPVSIRVVIGGAGPRLSCRGEGGQWSGEIPEGATGEIIRGSATGPGSVTIAGGGDGLVVIRQVSARDLLSAQGYGLMIRDLKLAESVVQANG
ncbi:MAG: hypothetical protein DCC49_11210 [Acidobacteria bacterium]|nr:MAG: hypothetical protein DCC49_11210 [Acidobacteriota bacterium]